MDAIIKAKETVSHNSDVSFLFISVSGDLGWKLNKIKEKSAFKS